MTHYLRTGLALAVFCIGAGAAACLVYPEIKEIRSNKKSSEELVDSFTQPVKGLEVLAERVEQKEQIIETKRRSNYDTIYSKEFPKCIGVLAAGERVSYVYNNGIVTNSLIPNADNTMVHYKK